MKIQKHIVTSEEKDIQIEEITLLSKEEYLNAKGNILPIDCWWWLRSPGDGQDCAASVIGGGSLDFSYVSCGSGCVRPALKISNLKSSKLDVGDKFEMADFIWTVIMAKDEDCLALCDTSVGETCFRKDVNMDNANKYEVSDIKKWLANWAKKHRIEVKWE